MSNQFINTPDPLALDNSMIDIESSFHPSHLQQPEQKVSFFGTVTEVPYFEVDIYVKNDKNEVKAFKTLYYKDLFNSKDISKQILDLKEKVEKQNLILQVFYSKHKTKIVKYDLL